MTPIFKGATSRSIYLVMVASNGSLKTGLAYTAITARYTRTRGSSTSITAASLAAATTAWTSGGWFEVDSTNQKGLYRFDVPDAAFATGADTVVISVKAGTNVPEQFRAFDLIDWNDQVAAIPNVAASAVGGLLTAPTTANVATADLVRVDGLTTTDGSAVLKLKRLTIANNTSAAAFGVTNSAGDAFYLESTSASGTAFNLYSSQWYGMFCYGDNAGFVSASTTGPGAIFMAPDSADGPALQITSNSSTMVQPALELFATNAPAIKMSVTGDDGGHGVAITSSGAGKHDVALLGSGDVLSADIAAPGSVSDATPGASGFDGDSGLSASNDFYNGSVLAFTAGGLKGIARKVTDYTGSSRTFAFTAAFPTAPADGDSFLIFGRID